MSTKIEPRLIITRLCYTLLAVAFISVVGYVFSSSAAPNAGGSTQPGHEGHNHP
jgi:hypothetical protein